MPPTSVPYLLESIALRLRRRLQFVIRFGHNLSSGVLPAPFGDPAVEAQFVRDFRLAGLRSTAYACSVAVVGYLLIWSVDVFFNGWSAVAAVRRLIVIALLGLIIVLVLLKPPSLLRHYNSFLGSLVFVAYVSSVSVTHLFRDDDPTVNINPTALIGLWIIYGFIRLPLKVTIFLGVAGGSCALFGSRLTNMHDPTIRTLIYLIVANVLGITNARSVEVRERQLYLQRRTLEQAQSDLRDRNRVAEQSSAEKTRLIAAVGHDLRQPMMAAILHLSVLMGRLDAGDTLGVQRQARRVLESVNLLGGTLEHLLLAARYDAGTEPINLRDVSLKSLLQRVADLSEPQATERQLALLIRMPRSELTVQTDEQTLLRTLVNLVSNALKFTRTSTTRRARVIVRVGFANGVCRILIADNGIGIADSDTDSIWRPFFQVDNRERNRDNGLGLGLYLVKQSLSRLDGHSVLVKSKLGRGTRFVLTLPGRQGHSLLEPSLPSEVSMRGDESDAPDVLHGMYILVVEDDHEARIALQTQLEEWGAVLSAAGTMNEALHAHAETERTVDAIVADYRLPGEMTGIDLIRAVRGKLGYISDAVLMTAEVESGRLIDDLPERTYLLKKPFDPAVLRRLLSGALERALENERSDRPIDPLT